MAKPDALQNYREARDSLKDSEQALKGLKDLEEVAKERAGDDEEMLAVYQGRVDEAQEAVTEAEKRLKKLNKGVTNQIVKALQGQVEIDNTVLMDLEAGSTTILQAAQAKKIVFNYDLDNPKADTAADLFSAWTTEIAEEDPELAKEITKALASTKIKDLLK